MLASSLGDLFHLDVVAGGIARGLAAVAHPAMNTLDDVGVYHGRAPEHLFPAPHTIPTVRVTRRWTLPGVTSDDVAFTSLHEPIEPRFRERYLAEYGETHTVYARRLRPSTGGRGLRLVYLHGYLQPETHVEELVLASMAVQLDMEIVQLQPPYHGRRTPRGAHFGGEFYCTADLVRTIEALRQSVLDARTLLSWLLAHDPRPVGLAGLSLGGLLASILTCVESRFAFSVPMIAHMDLGALFEDAPILAPMRDELAAFGWQSAQTRALVARMGWDELRPLVPADRIHLFAATDDRLFSATAVDALWSRWGRPAIHWYPTSHIGFIARWPDVVQRIAAFIARIAPSFDPRVLHHTVA